MNPALSALTVTSERERRSLSLKFSRLEKDLKTTEESVSTVTEDTAEVTLIQEHQEQWLDYKKDLVTA
jgi:hypothetical protein